MKIENQSLMTSKEASEYLKIPLSYFRKMMMRRVIPMYKSGGKTCFFKQSHLDAYLEGSRIASQSEVEAETATYIVKPNKKFNPNPVCR